MVLWNYIRIDGYITIPFKISTTRGLIMNKLIHEEQLHLDQVVGTIDKLVKEAKNVNKNKIKDTVDAQVAAISEKKIRQLKG